MSIKADNYVTTLGPEMLKRAKDEFGEIERLRETNIIAMRDWIKKQPHFMSSMTTSIYKKIYICITLLFKYNHLDAMFLTKFIRICKFSLEEAKKKLDSMLTVRSKIYLIYLLAASHLLYFYFKLFVFSKAALPEFFSNWDPMESSNQEALNCGYYFAFFLVLTKLLIITVISKN